MKPELVERWVAEWRYGPRLMKASGKYTPKMFQIKKRDSVEGFGMPWSSQYGRDYEGICETKEAAIVYLVARGEVALVREQEELKRLGATLDRLKAMLPNTEAR